MELIDLQCDTDTALKSKLNDVDILAFYLKFFQNQNSYPSLKNHAVNILCMFGSRYVCEEMFSTMKINKSKYRSRLTDEHFQSFLKINIFDTQHRGVMKRKRSQVSSFQGSSK